MLRVAVLIASLLAADVTVAAAQTSSRILKSRRRRSSW